MPKAKPTNRLIRNIIFILLALPLSYFFIAGGLEASLLSLIMLSVLYLVLRPFAVSVKAATIILVVYLALSGLLSFSQPLFSQSWPVFVMVLSLSSLLQPLVFVMLLDTILDILGKKHRVYDTVLVVMLWLSSLVVTFGATALVHGTDGERPEIFLLFLIPWLINGVVFLAAALVLAVATDKKARLKTPQKKTKKRSK